MRWLSTWNQPRGGDSGGKGQIGLVRSHGFTSWVIRLVTRSPYNHIVYDTGTELVSAEYPVVVTRPYGQITNICWSQFPETSLQADKMNKFARKQVGDRYSWEQDIEIGLDLILHRHMPRWVRKWLQHDGKWICSDLTDQILRHGGIELFAEYPTVAVHPGLFYRFFKDAGWLPKTALFSRRDK